jgi:N-acyl homoserine lactone hydrolase
LHTIGLDFQAIQYFAFSHAHVDHLGNANALTAALWILNERDLEWVRRPGDKTAELISNYNTVQTKFINSDYDVFGDGTVVILQTPGHTPGHQSLQIHLQHSGCVILSGDLWHSRENYEFDRVPAFNTSRAETMASAARIRKILSRTNGRLIIQHEMIDFNSLPKFPAYLD